MSELKLIYRPGKDLLEAKVTGAAVATLTSVQRGKVTLQIEPSKSSVDSFRIDGFRHFVEYHLLAQLFGDNAIREISAFQTAAAEAGQEARKTIYFDPPSASHRVVNDLVKAA